jgi:hypothetical protein
MKNQSFLPANGNKPQRNQSSANFTSKTDVWSSLNITKATILVISLFFVLTSMQSYGQSACQKQMFNIGYLYGSNGYTCVYEKYNSLEEGYSRKHEVYLRYGSYYELCAVCDNDCGDIDIKLYDGYGNLIAQDNTDDDVPVVSCRVVSSGYFTVKVIMADCADEPCNYGLSVFKK